MATKVDRAIELTTKSKPELEAILFALGETAPATATENDLVRLIMKHENGFNVSLPAWLWPTSNLVAAFAMFILAGMPEFRAFAALVGVVVLVIDVIGYIRAEKPKGWTAWQRALKDNQGEIVGIVSICAFAASAQPWTLVVGAVAVLIDGISEIRK